MELHLRYEVIMDLDYENKSIIDDGQHKMKVIWLYYELNMVAIEEVKGVKITEVGHMWGKKGLAFPTDLSPGKMILTSDEDSWDEYCPTEI